MERGGRVVRDQRSSHRILPQKKSIHLYVSRAARTQEEALFLYTFRRTTHLMQYGGGGITSIDVVVQVVRETIID